MNCKGTKKWRNILELITLTLVIYISYISSSSLSDCSLYVSNTVEKLQCLVKLLCKNVKINIFLQNFVRNWIQKFTKTSKITDLNQDVQ